MFQVIVQTQNGQKERKERGKYSVIFYSRVMDLIIMNDGLIPSSTIYSWYLNTKMVLNELWDFHQP